MADGSSMRFDHEDGNLTSGNDDADGRDTTETTDETPPYPEAAAEDPQEGAVPPGYDWPTHGGYLGCLLSLMASCLIGGFLGTTLFAALGYSHALPTVVTGVLTLVVYLGVTVGLGRLGWILGKRFYREYPQARGESVNHIVLSDSRPAGRDQAPEEIDSRDESEAQRRSSGAVDTPVDTR